MTTLTIPLVNIGLAAQQPDVVRSCVVLQPSPPPDPGEAPPAPVTSPGIYTPIAPGVTYANLPVAPTIVDTSPDQMIGCIVTVADNPQGRLNALFPSAISGDGVIDRATNDIWVYDGATWNNVGPTPGPTITATVVIPPWNETLLAVARTRTKLSVDALAYALELLTEPDPIVTTTALAVRSAPAFIRIPDTDFSFTVHVPAVAGSASAAVPLTTSALAAQIPAVSSGGAVIAPPVNINVTAFVPENTGTASTNVFVPAASTVTTPYSPSLSTGVSLSTNTFDISLAALTPVVYDPDAAKYIRAVETADSQNLEHGVKEAINTFVLGCKADGTWSAIKAACILAGARTLAGALVPLAGTAPTNNNFVAGDYNRKTGLDQNSDVSKWLDSNYSNQSASRQNNNHQAVWATKVQDGIFLLGNNYGTGGDVTLGTGSTTFRPTTRNMHSSASVPTTNALVANILFGSSRSASGSYAVRVNGQNYVVSIVSASPTTGNIGLFRLSQTSSFGASDIRLAFYSIGESLNLTLLDSRVTTLMSDITAAIP